MARKRRNRVRNTLGRLPARPSDAPLATAELKITPFPLDSIDAMIGAVPDRREQRFEIEVAAAGEMVSAEIRRMRERLKLSQEELAALVATTQTQISRYEDSEHGHKIGMFAKIAYAVGWRWELRMFPPAEKCDHRFEVLVMSARGNLSNFTVENWPSRVIGNIDATPFRPELGKLVTR